MVNLTINGKKVEVKEGTTILEAASKVNIDIPTLCFLKDVNEVGDCRMCVVEVEGMRGLIPACIQKVSEGMVVNTASNDVVEARRTVLDLILSNHDRDCLTCSRNGNCELQKLARDFGIDDVRFDGEKHKEPIDDKSPSIMKNLNKCILCRRCVATCKKIQGIRAIDVMERGFNSKISTYANLSLNDVNCTFCGQCIEACPVGALKEIDNTTEVLKALRDPDKYVIVQTAPAVRAALGEEFGMPVGRNSKGKMISALRELGFDKVFDTNTGADFTIMEEGTEFIERIQNKGTLPMITSCCPSWVRYLEINYPDLIPHLSTCKSPHQMYGALLKSYYAEKENIDPSKIYVVSVMPCIAKKFERTRKDMDGAGYPDVDAVITTRELAKMIRKANINFIDLPDTEFDDPMGEATGAAAIFGTTGGVMEAALRSVADILEGKSLDKIEYEEVRGEKGIKRASLNIAGKDVKVVVASGLKNAETIMEEIKSGKADYDFVEIMACPGGCVMGGGQPIRRAKERMNIDIRKRRSEVLYDIDEKSVVRKSHENPVLKKIYKEYLGEAGGKKAHKLLHTSYEERKKYNLTEE